MQEAFEGSRDWVFAAESERPDPIKHPAACLAHPWEGVLRAGDLLFVPNDCPHQVSTGLHIE
jgi:ribosomal protein L16 Arg81 hydroxylase